MENFILYDVIISRSLHILTLYKLRPFIDSACLEAVYSIFKAGSTLKCHNALGFDFTALNDALCMPVRLHFSTIKHLWLALFLRSNWKNSHRFFLESLQPLNRGKCVCQFICLFQVFVRLMVKVQRVCWHKHECKQRRDSE